jgi:large exoprotein involved in heme utilization and adhesion
VDKKQDASSVFFITGKSGLPPNPYEPLSSNHIWEDVPSPTQSSENYTLVPRASSSLWLSSNKTMEAQSWLINEKGEVVLVSEQPIAPVYRGCRLH